MLVLARNKNETIVFGDGHLNLTVLNWQTENEIVKMEVNGGKPFWVAVGETRKIAEGVEVMLVGFVHGHARIGCIAPREMSVHRLEVLRRIKRGETQRK